MYARCFSLRTALVAILAFGVGGATAAMALGAEDAALPRYKLRLGQQLVYKTVDKGEQKNKYPMEWTLRVVRQNPDKSWHIVFTQEAFSRAEDGYIDLAADGQIVENRSLGPSANPTLLLPPLPPDEASVLGTWSAELSLDATRRKFRSEGEPRDGTWKFSESPVTIFDPIYQSSTERDYEFDMSRGLVTEVTSTSIQGWPKGRSDEPYVQHIELVSDEMIADVDLAELATEYDEYFAVRKKYDELTSRSYQDFAHAAELCDQAEAVLKQSLKELKLPQVRSLVEAKLKRQADVRKYALDEAEKFGGLIGQPSAEWKTTNLEGEPRSLESYRGKVVLLDFWYRGCGWCIRAMPQIKQLASDFDGPAGRRVGDEQRPESRRRPIRDREDGAQLPDAQKRPRRRRHQHPLQHQWLAHAGDARRQRRDSPYPHRLFAPLARGVGGEDPGAAGGEVVVADYGLRISDSATARCSRAET